MAKDIILDVKHLKKYFNVPGGKLHAVDDLTFQIERGKTLGIVGESGCGKSTTGRVILQLLAPTSGEVLFEGKNVFDYNTHELRASRKDMQIIFQDPFGSLNPRMTVSQTIREPMEIHNIGGSNEERDERVSQIMETVGLAERLVNAYPHELDGGRRQRIGVARALAVDPKFIVCDEPVSALDVSIQAQILNLLQDLQEERGLTYIFITHDLSVIYHLADEIAVMYLGQIVERAPADMLFDNPSHPYTQALISAIPIPDIHYEQKRIILKGEITSPINPPQACRFAKRCNYATERCFKEQPHTIEIEPGHEVACFLFDKDHKGAQEPKPTPTEEAGQQA